jgi:hypothetical protein
MRAIVPFTGLIAAAVLAAAGPASAATAKRDRCAPHKGERVLKRSASAVVLGNLPYASAGRVVGCSRASGRRRTIAGAKDMLLARVLLTGTRVALVQYGSDRSGENSAVIVADDALHGGRRALVGRRDEAGAPTITFPTVVLAADGRIAWLEPRFATTTLRAWRPGDTVRTLDEGIVLSRVAFGSGTLTWNHGGAPRSAPTAPADRCALSGLAGGDAELDLLATPGGTTACSRATGVAAALPGANPARVALDHDWAAAWAGDSILVANPTTSAGRTIPAGGPSNNLALAAGTVALDAGGSVAWITATPSAFSTVYVDDGGGTRVVWDGQASIDAIQHDGSTALWLLNVPAYGTVTRALMTP